MTADALAWALGIAASVLTAAFLFVANWCHKLSGSVKEQAKDIANMRAHVAENYVRGHEISEVKRAVETLRQDLTKQISDLLGAVHELIGQAKSK